MSVSVIIPTYNRIALIRYTLDSLAAHRHAGTAMEIIVVDDGSTDGTEAYLAQHYPAVKVLRNAGKGAAAARNTGLAAAAGSYIMYLDSDDLVGEGYFTEKTALLDASPELDACYGGYDAFSAGGEFDPGQVLFRHKYPMLHGPASSRQHLISFLGGSFTPPHSIIWRRSFLLQIKGHDESLAINQDVELFIRAIFHGMRIEAVEDGTKVYVRHHNLDKRVGDPENAAHKWQQILDLRKDIFAALATYNFNDRECREALSNYLFNYWRQLRHATPGTAAGYLALARQVHWPVQLKGNALLRALAAAAGPVNAVRIKYFLLKRD